MPKNKLEGMLKSFHALSAQEITQALNFFETKSIPKNNILIEAGQTCDWIAFVQSGILRNYYLSASGEEVSYCLTFPGQFITAYSSFISNEPTFEYIHAMTTSEILVIRQAQYLELIEQSSNWLKFSKFFAEQSYILMEHRLISLQMKSAEERYQDLINQQPELLQHIPLKYLASYLGITQRHLSRLRKNLSF